jgi:NAD(P)-dependent dehydrogenase (short-subunit alcohol dehydrogenase family)
MQKVILVTGSTDGIGLEAAKTLVGEGHRVLMHGRNQAKLENAKNAVASLKSGARVESYVADLSRMADVEALASAVSAKHARLDVLINNAGIFKTPNTRTHDGLDVRFMVNTLAPYSLTKRLLPLMGTRGRVVNVSSAAQATVDLGALAGQIELADMEAYAQSKLAMTAWSRVMGQSLDEGPAVIAVNPGSLLGTRMVKEGFGVAGGDIRIGAEILKRAALSDEFAAATGQYFDNDKGAFGSPHPDALDPRISEKIVRALETVLATLTK